MHERNRTNDNIDACKIYAQAIIDSIELFYSPENSYQNSIMTLHDIKDFSNWMLETIKPTLNNDKDLNEYKKLKALEKAGL